MSQDKKRVALYCRVSTADQNCDRQERDLTPFAERGGFEVIQIYKEVASGAKNDRAKRRQVMAVAQARKIDAILVTELSRWGRSLQDLINSLNELNSYGVSIIAEKGFQFDLNTPQGKMLAGVLGALSEFERDLIAERVKSGMSAAKARGKHVGRKHGISKSVPVKKIESSLNSGSTVREIAEDLKISPTTVMRVKKEISRKSEITL